MWICVQCHTSNRDDRPYCRRCGAPLPVKPSPGADSGQPPRNDAAPLPVKEQKPAPLPIEDHKLAPPSADDKLPPRPVEDDKLAPLPKEEQKPAPLPIASCEVLTRRQAFLEWFRRRAVDYVQPDVTKVGGLTEEGRIAQAADDHSILFVPHGWNTAVGLAADLQLASAFPGTDLVEYLTGSPFIDEITAGGWPLDADGMLAIPSGPGLGLELDTDAVKKYTGGEKLL